MWQESDSFTPHRRQPQESFYCKFSLDMQKSKNRSEITMYRKVQTVMYVQFLPLRPTTYQIVASLRATYGSYDRTS
jgi:hypothetical protein